MEDLLQINSIIKNTYDAFGINEINKFKYNDDESYIDSYIEKYKLSTSEEFKEAKEQYLKLKLFKNEVEKIEKDKNSLKKLFEDIVRNDYYEIANFLVEKTDIDVSELLDLFSEQKSIDKIKELLLSKSYDEKNIGFDILLNCIEKNKNLNLIKNLIYFVKTTSSLYNLYKSKYFNKCPNSIDFLIEKALSINHEQERKARLINLIQNSIENSNLELFERLLNKERLINNLDFNEIFNVVFKNENIDIINIFLKNNPTLRLESLEKKYELFLLEYFSKNNSPEELKNRVISEILKKKYVIKDVSAFYSDQWRNQIKLDKIFEYDKKTKKITEIDKGYSKYNKNIKNELLYEIKYLENGEKKIIYYEKGSNGTKELITTTINTNNEIVFDTKNINYDLETFQNKVNEILEANYEGIDFFDYPLSYLTYAPLQLQQNKNNKDNTVFITNCNNIDTIKNIINNSLEKDEYKNKTIICDFAYNIHNVQIVVCNGKLTIINTLDSTNELEWKVVEKIQARFDKKIDIKEIAIVQQEKNNCVEASKLNTIALAMQFSDDFENFSELNERLNKLEDLIEKMDKLSEEENLTKEEKVKKQIDYINKNLTDDEYAKHFKLLMTISNSCQQLINKSQHFMDLQVKFREFENNFIKAKCDIELSENDREFMNSIVEENRSFFYGHSLKNSSYDEIIDYCYKQKLYYGINNKNYNYTNPINGENYEINQKMQFFLISIKLGNIWYINDYIKALEEYAKNDINLIKENIKNIIETNFELKNDLYAKEVIKIFNKKIKEIDLKNSKILISDFEIPFIKEFLKKSRGQDIKERTLDYSYDDREQNKIYPHTYNKQEIILNHKTQCWLTAIKYCSIKEEFKNNNQLLNQYIDSFMIKLVDFIGKENKKQLKEALKIIKGENFEIQAKSGNIYAKEIVDRFNKKIERIDLEEKFINFNKNKTKLKNKTFIQIENNKSNKKTIDYINKLIENYNHKNDEIKLKSIDLDFTSESIKKDKEYIYIKEEDFNFLINKLDLDKQATLNLQ